MVVGWLLLLLIERIDIECRCLKRNIMEKVDAGRWIDRFEIGWLLVVETTKSFRLFGSSGDDPVS
jgi:hypothetical protein